MMAPQLNFRTFLFSYHLDGTQYVLEMPAESAEEARRKVARLQFANFDGELAVKLPVKRRNSAFLEGILNVLLPFISRRT